MILYLNTNSYLKLPPTFYEVIRPEPIANPFFVQFNQELAASLWSSNPFPPEPEALAFFSGNSVPKTLQSIALAYAGHQFGYFVPLLGDGRALLLGEIAAKDGKQFDIQLKGSGKTKFSRMGDGRAPLSAVLREYLISEAMHGFNIPTTRSLAAIGSKETILRQNGPVPLGVLTRVASSSLRVGSFEYAAAQQDKGLLESLANYALERHYPELLSTENPYLAFFKEVVDRQASLIAQWMSVGFIHGVMNTDNMTISGETIDYGPCAFMDEFDYGTVFSSIDRGGRYAYGNQASIAKWNLAQLAQSLQALCSPQEQQELFDILNSFTERFFHYWNTKISQKLGFWGEYKPSKELINQFFILLQQHQPDFTNTFRCLSKALDCNTGKNELIKALGNQPESAQWVTDWLNCLNQQSRDINQVKADMNQVNPAYIPRNHLVEEALRNYIEHEDRTLFDTLLALWKNPFQQKKNTEHYQCPPLPHQRVHQTFCGT